MDSLVLILCIFGTVLIGFCLTFLFALLKSTSRIIDVNKQLMILVAGKEAKPEALRALVASNKPPQGKLKGVATGKKKEEKKPTNVDYALTIGGNNGV